MKGFMLSEEQDLNCSLTLRLASEEAFFLFAKHFVLSLSLSLSLSLFLSLFIFLSLSLSFSLSLSLSLSLFVLRMQERNNGEAASREVQLY
jgi:hypothetical protein